MLLSYSEVRPTSELVGEVRTTYLPIDSPVRRGGIDEINAGAGTYTSAVCIVLLNPRSVRLHPASFTWNIRVSGLSCIKE
jgi:hypothetical protein